MKSSGRKQTVPWLRGVVLWLALAVYVTACWGHFGRDWPGWVRSYAGWLSRGVWQAYVQRVDAGHEQVRSVPGHGRVRSVRADLATRQAVWAGTSLVFGGVVPLAAIFAMGRRPRVVGLRRSNRWGGRVVAIGVLVTVPFAYAFSGERMDPGTVALQAAMPTWVQLAVVIGVSLPEHLLLTGIAVAGFLPGGRLPVPGPLAEVDGGLGKRILRWLGLAQPAAPGSSPGGRFLAWWGLDEPALTAILGGGLLFGLVHVGARPIEFVTSFPGGVAVCYVTYRSGSIWPAWLIHMAQVVLVFGFLAMRGG